MLWKIPAILLIFVAGHLSAYSQWDDPTYDDEEEEVEESQLLCPNAFSPFSSPGINDEWRVSYKAIAEFECHIFNRLGIQLITLTDPTQGWDGTYKGKRVSPGAYYYVIKAKGEDGKVYNLAGDINIINSKGK